MKQETKKKSNLTFVIAAILVIVVCVACLAFNKESMFGNNKNNDNNIVSRNASGNNGLSSDLLSENKKAKISGDGYYYYEGSKQLEGVEFSNIRVKELERNKCEFVADVKNTTDKFLEPSNIRVKVVDDSGKVDEIFAGILTELAPYEPNQFKTHVLSDITDFVDFEFEKVAREE